MPFSKYDPLKVKPGKCLFNLCLFFKLIAFVYEGAQCHGVYHVEAREQLSGLRPLIPPCGWVLGMKLLSSGLAASDFACWVISPIPQIVFISSMH